MVLEVDGSCFSSGYSGKMETSGIKIPYSRRTPVIQHNFTSL